ncbi:MAG TPA: helix-turn-helix domain-containing protein [Novosphingobium sp.]|nr:helix-turn-helix domain-containing protein [Novosphingobium sp.]
MSLKIVKSARRVLDLLEYFATIRRAASVSEVEHALDIPQSSASVLMRSLVALGYLEYLPSERRFRPTLRVAKLGDWVQHGLPGPLTAELEMLRNRLQETIILGRRQGAQVEFIYLLMADRAIQFYARRNSLQPMTLATVGRALLAQLPESTARGIIRRNNADALLPLHTVNEADLLRALEHDREAGFSETQGSFGGERDFHVIAKALPRIADGEQLAVGVAGPKSRMIKNRDEVLHALDEWIARAVSSNEG